GDLLTPEMVEALNILTEQLQQRLRGCHPDDLLTEIDDLTEDPRSQRARSRVKLSVAQRAALLRDWDELGLTADGCGPEYAELGRLLFEINRLQFVLLGELAGRGSMGTRSSPQPWVGRVDPFAIFDHPDVPVAVVSAVLAGSRLDLLVPAWHLAEEDEGFEEALKSAVIRATLNSARAFLALLVFVVDTETNINPRIDVGLLPLDQRLHADELRKESRALRESRQQSLAEAKHRRAR
ncbi:MAG: hypothetical protein AAGD06_32610, partial [Acidobacteriota bacterium]